MNIKPSDITVLLKTIQLASRGDVEIAVTETSTLKITAERDLYDNSMEIHLYDIAEDAAE